MLTARTPFVQRDFALHDMIFVLVGVVVGGIDRLWTATLGGFAIGFASGIINGALPTDRPPTCLPCCSRSSSSCCSLRPAGLFVRGRRVGGGTGMRRAAPRHPASRADAAVVVGRRRPRPVHSQANEHVLLTALVSVAIVVAIYVFVGNSGVLSFGQISFVQSADSQRE